MSKISLQKNWREILFSFVMGIGLIFDCAVVIKEQTMSTLLLGNVILAFCFMMAFFLCQGFALPDKKTWDTFGNTMTVCLGIMFITQVILSILLCKAFDAITGEQLATFICLCLGYALVFFFFVLQLCDYKGRKEQEKI